MTLSKLLICMFLTKLLMERIRTSTTKLDWRSGENRRMVGLPLWLCSFQRWEQVHTEHMWQVKKESGDISNIILHDWFGSGSVMVWQGISLEGQTSARYKNEILRIIVRTSGPHVPPGTASCDQSVQAMPGSSKYFWIQMRTSGALCK